MMRPLFASALAFSLCGCISFGAEPPEQLLSLTPAQAEDAIEALIGPA